MPAYDKNAKSYYKLAEIPNSDPSLKPHYRISKFNEDLNVESSYLMNFIQSQNGGYYDCSCPAAKFDCRHKEIKAKILAAGEVNSEKFFCYPVGTFKLATEI